MTERVLRRVLAAYQVVPARMLPPQKGYRNISFPIELTSGEMVNFILYKNEAGIAERILRSNTLADDAARHGLPVRRTKSPRIIRLRAGSQIRYGALYHYLPGATIPWEAYTRRHIKLVGQTLKQLHTAVRLHPTTTLPNVIDEYQALVQRMEHYFERPEVAAALRAKLGLTLSSKLFAQADRLLEYCRRFPSQPLHMDFVRGNILFQTGEQGLAISGILDFEKAAHGPKSFDIARTVAFLLVDGKYITPAKLYRHFFAHGQPARRDRYPHTHLIEELVGVFLLYDFYKFLRHNPYESLPHNEHFTRTVEHLRKRQRLSVEKA